MKEKSKTGRRREGMRVIAIIASNNNLLLLQDPSGSQNISNLKQKNILSMKMSIFHV